MSVAVAIICISLCTFVILSVLAVALYLQNRELNNAWDAKSVSDQSDISCDIEAIVLDETMQLSNFGDSSVRLQSAELSSSTLLYPTDQWLRKFDSRHSNTFQFFCFLRDGLFEERVLEITVTADEVMVKPINRASNLTFTIWKLKPAVYMQATHVLEHQVFHGLLQKTVNFSRAPGKYYKIRASTQRQSGIISGSNVELSANRLQLLTLKIEQTKVVAVNQSNRQIRVSVEQHTSGELLKRELSNQLQELPNVGVFNFSIRPIRSSNYKNLARIRLSPGRLAIEPPGKFGSLPLHCEIFLPNTDTGDSPKQIVSSQMLSELQLPRKAYCYLVTLSVRAGDEELCDAAEATSYTLE